MARLYSNENFPQPVVERLRTLGHDVLTVKEAGYANAAIPDSDVLAFATQEARAVLTINRKDFIDLHKNYHEAGTTHAGIIVCTKDDDFKRLATNIHRAIQAESVLADMLLKVYKSA